MSWLVGESACNGLTFEVILILGTVAVRCPFILPGNGKRVAQLILPAN